ncbi:type VI secretion system-associated protein TagK [Salmonella enterica]|nr:type VI secretion system-associated protein TagK [Salmonella enterica]ECK4963527.1 type VI secretion system-associated protein TagK [Salmonella enterica]ECW1821631.1 type VI secretion system-associated protein TagK [Salmonella enterica]EFV0245135.1 type VI secretion system-associated protein TagK [Salmonella enterica]EFV5163230.1 type VI secretion system-associated protein TagK [Salmonella enterica]
MKQDMWELRKIQSQGITDNAQYPAGTYIVFTAAAPYIPLFEQHGKDDIALSLVRHEEAWWIVNHSDELCCAVNEQVMEPHHRMRLNDGDTIEWGLSSWCLARTNDESRPDVSFPQLVQSSESVAEYLDLDWFKQQQLNPQNPFDIIPVRETAPSYTGHEADSTLHQLYQEYQQALRPSGQEKPLRDKPFPRNEDAVTQDLTSLYDKKGDTDTLQDMVAGAPGIDAILDTLDTTGEGEMHWLAMESMPDILQLLSLRVLILLLRSRIQQAGAQGLAEMLTQLAELSVIWSDALHPQLLTGEGAPAESIEDAALARSNALAALLDHEGVMADIRGITLSNSAVLRLQVRDVERALSAPRPADALAPESVRQQLADLEARGALPLAAFREAQESAERLQVWARETLGDLAPDFSRLRQLLALLPDVVQTTTPEIPPSPAPVPDPAGTVMDNAVPARAEDVPPVNAPPGISLPHNAEPGPIRDRNDALERLRCIRRWFESSEPSSPTIPLLRQAERLVGKRFSEVINEIPVELLEKWDALE